MRQCYKHLVNEESNIDVRFAVVFEAFRENIMDYAWVFLLIIPCAVMKVEKNGYYPVSACPKDAKEWEASSRRLKCNNTHNYHCAPGHDRSQLYEFCYEMAVLKVEKGHCLGIAESGNLNFDRCHFFAQGCPDEVYYSNEIYKYPSCLSIQENCYTEDCVCNCFTTSTKSSFRKGVYQYAEQNENRYLIPLVICCIITFLSIILNILQLFRSLVFRKENFPKEHIDEQQNLVPNTEEENSPDNNSRTQNHSENEKLSDQIYEKTLASYTIEDSELFRLLKRQCLNGIFSTFKHLVLIRVKYQRKQYIFYQCDEKGCLLLHYAAQGGSILIVQEILQNSSDEILEYRCIRGETALYFAIKYKKRNVAEHLIVKHLKRITELRKEAETTGIESQGKPINVKDDVQLVTFANGNAQKEIGGFSPVHWAAWYGDSRLLYSLKQANFDIWTETRNGLNILDIACMSDELKGDIEFCRYLLENNLDKISPMKTDLSGLNIAHFASMSNRCLLEFIAKNKNEKLKCLLMKETKSKKTCLHIACEFGKIENVKLIAKNFKQLISCVDEFGGNALHYAAKGGNLDILKYLIDKYGLDIKSLTSDDRTILHTACIHKNVEICRYAVNHFSKELLNAKTKDLGLTAAHYLGVESKGDGSEMTLLEIFCKSEMDLSVFSYGGLSVLDRAVDHLNADLIRAMVGKQFRERCGINIDVLNKKLNNTDHEEMKGVLQEAIRNIKTELTI